MNGYLIWYLWVATFAILTLSRTTFVVATGWTAGRSIISSLLSANGLIGIGFGIGLPLVCASLGLYALVTTPPDSLAAPASSILLLLIAGLILALVFVVVHETRAWGAWIGDYRGASLMRSKRYSEALAVYERLVKRYPKMGRLLASKSMALYSLGRGVEALAAIERALTLQLGQAQGWMWKASVLTALQRNAEALEALQRALKIAPGTVEAWERQGYVLVRLGRYAEALTACDQAIALEAKNMRRRKSASQELALGLALATMATALNGLGRSAEALDTAERAISLNPYPIRSWLAKSIALEQLGRADEARAAAEQGLNVVERYLMVEPSIVAAAEAWFAKATLLRLLGRASEADAAEARSQALYAAIRGEAAPGQLIAG